MGAARKLTVEQWFDRLDRHDLRELVDGVLVECEVPNWPHEALVTWLIVLMGKYFLPRGGFVGGSAKLAIEKDRGRIPDVTVYAPPHRPELDVTWTPPDIAIEVISSRPRDARRDRIDKADDYAKAGVKHYWLVDPRLRTFEMWRLGSRRRYVREAAASTGAIRIRAFPGLTVDVDAIWRELDRLATSAL